MSQILFYSGGSYEYQKIISKALSIAILISGFHPGAQMQAAHAACVGYACDNQSPVYQGCGSDARTLSQPISADSLYVDLRYSPRCAARWSRTWYNATPASGGSWYRTYVNWYPYGSNLYATQSLANSYGQQIISPMKGVSTAKGCGQRVSIYRAAVCTYPA